MSECQCSIDVYHDDGPDPDSFSERTHRSRAPHKCHECHRVIEPGEMYRYESGIWEIGFASYKTCLDCLSLRNTFFCDFVYGSIWETFEEEAFENGGKFSPACIAQLTSATKRNVLDIIKRVRKELHKIMDDDD